MVLIVIITLLGFTEKTSFSSSSIYENIEMIGIISIVGAGGCELLVMTTNIVLIMRNCCRKNNQEKEDVRSSKKPAKNDPFVPLETEGQTLRTIPETSKRQGQQKLETPKHFHQKSKSKKKEKVLMEKKQVKKSKFLKESSCLDSGNQRKAEIKLKKRRKRSKLKMRRNGSRMMGRVRSKKKGKKVKIRAQKKSALCEFK